jgi:hypothetical protein
MAKKINLLNISLVPDGDLRPWTKDDDLDNKLLAEALALDKAISTTSPQKLAGVRGDSILDSKPDELIEYIRIKNGRTIDVSDISPLPSGRVASAGVSNAQSNSISFSTLDAISSNSKPLSAPGMVQKLITKKSQMLATLVRYKKDCTLPINGASA